MEFLVVQLGASQRDEGTITTKQSGVHGYERRLTAIAVDEKLANFANLVAILVESGGLEHGLNELLISHVNLLY